jgi:integrase
MRLAKVCSCSEPCSHPLHYQFKHKGQLYRGTTYTANTVLARRYADKVRQDTIADGVGLSTGWRAPTLSTHIAAYVEHQKGEFPRTASRDERVLQTFFDVVGDKRIDQVTQFDVERWRAARAKQASRNTVERDEHAVRGCFTYAEELYKKQKFTSPCAELKAWKPDEQKRHALSTDELAIALQRLPPRLALICRITVECLPRLSEVLDLQRSDLGSTWIGFRRKGGAVTKVQASTGVLTALWAMFETDTQQWAFGDPSDEERKDLVAWLIAVQARTSVAFTRAFRGIGLPGVCHHILRHTGVTLMLERGENPRVIQELAGWSSLRMLEKYGHVRNEAQARAVAGNAAVVAAAQNTTLKAGVPSGSRTRVSGLKGRRPRPLDDGDAIKRGSHQGSNAFRRSS